MNYKFTKLSMAWLLLLAMSLISFSEAHAQQRALKLRINNPEAEGLMLDGLGANFGPAFPAEITADIAFVNDGETVPSDNDTWSPVGFYGCVAPVNGEELNGKIAMTGRGTCEFGVKVQNVESSGAVAAIVANRAPLGLTVGTHTDGLVWMGAGAVGDLTVIPSLFITYEDRKIIEDLSALIGGPVNITILNNYMYDASATYAHGTDVNQAKVLDSIQLVLINRDTLPIPNVEVTATITAPGGSTTTLTASIDTLAPPPVDLSGELRVFFDEYSPSEVGTYTIEFSASTEAGNTPLDSETLSISFDVSDDYVLRLDNGDIYENVNFELNEAAYQGAGTLIFNIGAIYRTGATATSATYASFAIANAAELAPGLTFSLELFDADPDGDGNLDNDASNAVDRNDFAGNFLGSAEYELEGTETGSDLILVEFETPIALEANKTYILMLNHNGLLDDNFSPPAYSVAGDHNLAGYGNVWEMATIGTETYVFEVDGFEWWNDDTPGLPHGGLRPVLRLHLDGYVPVGTEDLPVLAADRFTMMPNPATELVNLQFDLENISEQVQVKVIDMMGKVVMSAQYENVQQDTRVLNVSQLPTGTYLVSVLTQEGYRTKKLVVSGR
ncbi:MAG TPA: T9SS type A sorting domain-containing protein [Saprospiraceae bacterium]|nr:T9SS type A sorting domain-containing protein [Saprospiraceae bacterium]HMQ81291.1 T9SS type A sorting domain-containing protein [Saprospiraceae bacterium]